MPKIHDRVLFVLCCVGVAAAVSCGFLNQAPNRLAATSPLPLSAAPVLEATGAILGLGLMAMLSLIPHEKTRSYATLGAATLLLGAILAGAGDFARELSQRSKPAMRLSLGPAFWILASVALLAILDAAQRAKLGGVPSLLLGLVLGAGFVVMAEVGTFDHLALAREFASHRDLFAMEFLRHLGLVGTSILCAFATGIPLTALVLQNQGSRGFVFTCLGILQTFPSIALFGLLMAPLTTLATHLPLLKALGIGGTGPAPAIIALTLYSLLPLVRGFYTGLAQVPAAVKDAASGLGFDRRRLFLEVELPLALPSLLSALRVATIQAIGLAAVAALIGAGGLGTLVFQGIGQYALDLVLLGAIPIIGLALVVDLVFRILLSVARSGL